MPTIDRRTFLKLMGLSAAAGSTSLLSACNTTGSSESGALSADFYDLPMQGNVRILHTTDFHGQLSPVYFREPNVNLGVGGAFGRPPHLVGNKLLKAMNLKTDTPESYAYTYIDFEKAAAKYGKTGGFPQMKTLLEHGGSIQHSWHRRHGRPLGIHL